MSAIEMINKRKEMLINELKRPDLLENPNERFRIEGQIRECNNIIFILSSNKQIKYIE